MPVHWASQRRRPVATMPTRIAAAPRTSPWPCRGGWRGGRARKQRQALPRDVQRTPRRIGPWTSYSRRPYFPANREVAPPGTLSRAAATHPRAPRRREDTATHFKLGNTQLPQHTTRPQRGNRLSHGQQGERAHPQKPSPATPKTNRLAETKKKEEA